MKLEIRHLAPYLSYKLKAINCLNDVTEIIGLQYGNESCNNELWTFVKNKNYLSAYLYECKPILFPLSSLKKEITIDGESFIPIREIKNLELFSHYELEDFVRNNFTYGYIESLSYQLLSQLFEWKIDVFGLIEAGLAEPVTENFNPYK